MVKLVLLILSFILGVLTSFAFASFGVLLQILIAIAFFLLYILGFIILFFIFLFFSVAFENMKKDRVYQSKYYRHLLNFYNKFLFSLFGMKVHYKGKKLIPDKPFLLVANHRSNLDSTLIDNYLEEYPLVFVAKKSLFKIPMVGKLIHGAAYISIDRDDLRGQYNAIMDSVKRLTREKDPLSIGIFPEGTRNKSERILPNEFKAGSFQIALRAKCPVVICALRGTKEVNDKLLVKKHDVYCDIIKVINYDEYKDMSSLELANYANDIIKDFLKENCKL